MHWAFKYLGKPWTEECRCYDWFLRIQKEQFGLEIPPIAHNVLSCFVPAQQPKEGDAVFLSVSKENKFQHIGIAIFPNSKLTVLHAKPRIGVMASSCRDLKLNNIKITGFWTYANSMQP